MNTTYYGLVSPFKRKYDTEKEIEQALAKATQIKDVAALRYVNMELINATPALKTAFEKKDTELHKH